MTELEVYKEKVIELIKECKSVADMELIYSILIKLQDCSTTS